jgi:DNA-binding response OmpR family regulator
MTSSRLRVLVVDDDVDLAETLQDILASRGHVVTLAYDGETAVALFRERPFDLCFMDVALPGSNGVECFLEIRRLRPTARVVMMTAYSLESLLARALEEGALAVLHKPLDAGEILRMVVGLKGRGVVLVVEDDADLAESLRDTLVGSGYSAVLARDGKAALESARAGGIDVLILDLRLPGMSGLEVHLELRRSGLTLPTVVVTGYRDEEAAAIGELEKGAVKAVLTKPLDMEAFIRAVESAGRAS